MCIVLYVKCIQCSGIPYIYGQLKEEDLGICTFCYLWHLFGEAVFHRCMVDWRGDTSALSICAFCSMWNVFSVVVYHTSMVNWMGYICHKYMCIVLYVKHIWCSGIPYISVQLEGDPSALSICALCYMWNIFHVVVFHTSMVSCSGAYICHKCMCILLYVKFICCSGIP